MQNYTESGEAIPGKVSKGDYLNVLGPTNGETRQRISPINWGGAKDSSSG
jgi:hypothetical protein